MAKMQVKGLEDWIANLEKLQDVPRETVGEIVTAGAAVVADSIRAQIEALPVKRPGEKSPDAITSVQKKGLREGFGIPPIKEKDDGWSIKMGFQGYNSYITKKYPNGVPNALIIASIEKGSSVRVKYPTVRNTVTQRRQEVIAAMRQTMADEFRDIFSKR